MKKLSLTLSVMLFVLGCANPPEDSRRELRALVKNKNRAESVAICTRILRGEPSEADPLGMDFKPVSASIRWQAAQNLGDLSAVEAYPVLRDSGLTELADPNPDVRRECIIALGKLKYDSIYDVRRKEAIELVSERLIGDDAPGRVPTFPERSRLARRALLDTLITLGMPYGYDPESVGVTMGYRDVGARMHAIALQLYSAKRRVRNGLLHEAMLEQVYEGLAKITATPLQEMRVRRETFATVQQFHSWWIERINILPRLDGSSE